MLRIVVRAGMTMEMADNLLEHLREITEFFESLDAPLPGPDVDKRTAFALTLKVRPRSRFATRAVRSLVARSAPDRQQACGGGESALEHAPPAAAPRP